MNQMASRIFLFFFALLTLIQLAQQLFHPFKLAGLQGAFDAGKKPIFTIKEWESGNYQQQADIYLKYQTAFNGELVRLRNQIDFSVFGNINTILTLGRDNYIYDPNYILAISGADKLADTNRVKITAEIDQTLATLDTLDIPILICFAPNKANYYFEYLPEIIVRSDSTNQHLFENLFQKHNTPLINFDFWFMQMKKSAEYLLVPKYGAHWSTYGAAIAADSLIKKMVEIRGGPLASFSVEKISLSSKPMFADDDYLASLNLMQKWISPQMAYPTLQFHDGLKPNVLIVTDSFIWNFYDLGIIQNCFAPTTSIRYYNKTLYDKDKNNLGAALPLTLDDLLNRDLVIVLSSAPGLNDFGYGFFNSVSQLGIHD